MTHTKIFSLALIVAYLMFSVTASASENSGRDREKTNSSKQMENQSSQHSKTTSSPADDHSKGHHGKIHAPHSEEEAHIHKFHKERVKKIRRHPGKYWLLSQLLLFLAHAAVLYISYLHALH